MEPLPLLSHESPTAPIAYRGGEPISAGQFVADVARLRAHLPAGGHVLNVCADRYRFAVGLAACLTTRRVSLLPSTYTPEVVRQLAQFAPDAFCLTDESDCGVELPRIDFPKSRRRAIRSGPRRASMPRNSRPSCLRPVRPGFRCPTVRLGAASRAAFKRRRRTARARAHGRAYTLVGTVPAQHMYGFESTVLLALQSGRRVQRRTAVLSGRHLLPASRRFRVRAYWCRRRFICARCSPTKVPCLRST